MKILYSENPNFSKKFKKILDRQETVSSSVEETVRKIIQKIRQKGDAALLDYTQKFDRHSPKKWEVSQEEIKKAFQQVSPQDLKALKKAAERIRRFHREQFRRIARSWRIRETGIVLGEDIRPLNRVGIYVPGGLASYPSTVLMNSIPAGVAGVKELIMVSPWMDGKSNPLTLVAAHLSGVQRIFKIGGAQAIAALAYGTETVPAVDKIVGPGNAYVATAKKIVFGKVGIDMIAGPTEVVIVADETARADYVASDLLSQAEHDPKAIAILITPSLPLVRAVLKEIQGQLNQSSRKSILQTALAQQGLIVVTKNLQEAADLSNQIAPEHLSLQVKNGSFASSIINAGAIFVGPYAPVAFGDYMAGPNHVLPTSGTARFSSPLGVSDFLKRSSVIEVQKRGLQKLGRDVIRLAEVEGLAAHAASIKARVPSPLAGEG